jgi:hypothetical protein
LCGGEEQWEAGFDSGEAVGDGRESGDRAADIGLDDGLPFAEMVVIGGGGVVGGDDSDCIIIDGLPDGIEIFGRMPKRGRADVFGAFPFVGRMSVVVSDCVGVEGGACSEFGGEEEEIVGACLCVDGEQGLLRFACVI